MIFSFFLFKKQSEKYVIECWSCGQVNLKPVHEIEGHLKSSLRIGCLVFFLFKGALLL